MPWYSLNFIVCVGKIISSYAITNLLVNALHIHVNNENFLEKTNRVGGALLRVLGLLTLVMQGKVNRKTAGDSKDGNIFNMLLRRWEVVYP